MHDLCLASDTHGQRQHEVSKPGITLVMLFLECSPLVLPFLVKGTQLFGLLCDS